MAEKIYGLLLAGGTGSRMGASRNKILLPVAGIPCIVRSAQALAACVDALILVCHAGEIAEMESLIRSYPLPCPVSCVLGGETRQASVHCGLKAIQAVETEDAIVLIHDGARCLVSGEVIQGAIASVRRYGTGIAAVPVSDTIRAADDALVAGETIPREGLYAMQTPQAARLKALCAAFDQARADGFAATDDAAVLSHAGFPVHLSPGSRLNLKLTTPEDLTLAEALFSANSP